ncbi:MAG TPA: immunoglobulin domain-containing protein, partial [Verrucomicrobiae bacterium]|nr:immunoglobulin domain-containing protein [Verrucomicrobiae bacterium]
TVLQTNRWYHVAMTYDGSIFKLYVNGALDAQSAASGPIIVTTEPVRIGGGADNSCSPYYFNGILDEAAIYNRALSSNEISAIYMADAGGKCFTPAPPTITAQPTNQTALAGSTTAFSVTVSGTQQLFYQWQFNGTNIAKATNAALNLVNVQLTNAGNYTVMITNLYGVTNSVNATLTVQAPPMISAQPTNQTTVAGSNTAFSITANGSPTLNFQWRLNGTNITGATNIVLELSNVQFTNGGNYSLRVTNLFGSAISSNGVLTVQAAPTINTQPTNLTTLVGNTAAFSAAAIGSPALSYQWSLNGSNHPIIGATNNSLTISNVQLANAGVYAVTVTNIFGSNASSNAVLNVIDVLDHFAWGSVPSPRFASAPFVTTIRAMDSINQQFTNFTGAVFLTTTNGIPLIPGISGSFTQGAWAGSITVTQMITNLVLRANDGAGHIGLANSIFITIPPSLGMAKSGNNLFIFWPMTPAGFALDNSYGLNPAQWAPVSAPPIQIGDQYLQFIQLNGTNQFYRLRFTLP